MGQEDWKTNFYCTETVVNYNILGRTEAYEWVHEHNIKVTYWKELEDGTPRRIWKLRDPEGATCGLLYTAMGDGGQKSKDDYLKDLFDFMETNVPRHEWNAPDKTKTPRTAYYSGAKNIAGQSNGNSPVSLAGSGGSIPSPATNINKKRR